MHHYTYSNHLYYLLEASRATLSPMRCGIMAAQEWFENKYNPLYHSEFAQTMRAALELSERLTRKYEKPAFNIISAEVNGKKYDVEESIILKKPFCNLLHFTKKSYTEKQPKLLIVAPLAGHHATLLRATVQEMLSYADVYITDWIDASQVPLSDGSFDMDDFIDYTIEFIKTCGQHTHVMAVCQPTVPVLAATAIMSSEKSKFIPNSIILMGGPVDARKSPTTLGAFAEDMSSEWFKTHTISIVPANYPGRGRKVYPGFLQLMGFIGLNWQKHVDSHLEMFQLLLADDDAHADIKKDFYDEYLSVMDLPAEFFLQTIEEVFHKFSLARGQLISRGRPIDTSSITKTALFGIEGENDDIAGIGQTKASLEICTGIPDERKEYLLQPQVGHYGVFSGSRFKKFIAPRIGEFIKKYD